MRAIAVLGTYLNDHLGGANTGVELARRLHGQVAGGRHADVLASLVADIESDRDELHAMVERLGQTGHPFKRAAGWIAGKIHQLALNELVTGDGHLSTMLQAETLALGIEGKQALWQALLAVAPAYPQLPEDDLERLVDRARAQRERIESLRLELSRRAFVTAPA